jgi:hypothetical protein
MNLISSKPSGACALAPTLTALALAPGVLNTGMPSSVICGPPQAAAAAATHVRTGVSTRGTGARCRPAHPGTRRLSGSRQRRALRRVGSTTAVLPRLHACCTQLPGRGRTFCTGMLFTPAPQRTMQRTVAGTSSTLGRQGVVWHTRTRAYTRETWHSASTDGERGPARPGVTGPAPWSLGAVRPGPHNSMASQRRLQGRQARARGRCGCGPQAVQHMPQVR